MQAVGELFPFRRKISEDAEKYLFDMSQSIPDVWFHKDQTKTQEQYKRMHVSLFISSLRGQGSASIKRYNYTNITAYPNRCSNPPSTACTQSLSLRHDNLYKIASMLSEL